MKLWTADSGHAFYIYTLYGRNMEVDRVDGGFKLEKRTDRIEVEWRTLRCTENPNVCFVDTYKQKKELTIS